VCVCVCVCVCALQATCVYFRETPGDYDFALHVAPRRQLIINLDADVEVTVCKRQLVMRVGQCSVCERGHSGGLNFAICYLAADNCASPQCRRTR
jgi:hypothetical protein